ncbi:glycosyltransferase family 4 protein [Methylovirgula sp. 4M-Z18]|uniref:glycosyltransferase family 4 protein n=1 Tax=Methylovirgula sp. 4M-Z18 TaxID=2293567 RepID=UPI000E2E7D48|nr:glycosyltransferase family 1 protein [Methylovirgula sp. 4M-Z18]RFB80121.1 glycosyltransferase family 1 protein [Methylovirgula sp. 4M-Z18]
MRIVIDLAAAQLHGRSSDVGRYSLALARTLFTHRGTHEIFTLLDATQSESAHFLRHALMRFLPPGNILAWQSVPLTSANPEASCQRNQVSQLIRDAFLAKLRPDLVQEIRLAAHDNTDQAPAFAPSMQRPYATAILRYEPATAASPSPNAVSAYGALPSAHHEELEIALLCDPAFKLSLDIPAAARDEARNDLAAMALDRAAASDQEAIAQRMLRTYEHLVSTMQRSETGDPKPPFSANDMRQPAPALLHAIAELECERPLGEDLRLTAQAIAASFPRNVEPQIFVDISGIVQFDAKTGVQRVTRSVLKALYENAPAGWRVEPVYAHADRTGYYYARRFANSFFDLGLSELDDAPIEPCAGDVFLGLDLQHDVVIGQSDYYRYLSALGVRLYFTVHDLLPVLLPHYFRMNKADPDMVYRLHWQWLKTISQFDGAICVSKAVADEFASWTAQQPREQEHSLRITWVHNGADITNSLPSAGMPDGATHVLDSLRARRSFLAVGTIEPRKGQTQILAAFDELWAQRQDLNLVLVGKQGWGVEALIERLRNHREFNARLFWLEGISDEYLEKIYAASACLIAASEGEGFGLPLIEAAQHKLPIIARDIPVFREVVGQHGLYFSGVAPSDLAECVKTWVSLDQAGAAPKSDDMPWQTWDQSAKQILEILLDARTSH